MNGSTRVFLVLLRLAIGWHFLFEGIEKIRVVDVVGPAEIVRPWSSLSYLREAAGPAADVIKRQVGDPDQEALDLSALMPLPSGKDSSQVQPRQRISPALDAAWNEYLDHFTKKHQLTDEQRKQAEMKMDQAKDQAVNWLLGVRLSKDLAPSTIEVEKSFNGTAAVKIQENSKERVDEYRAKVLELRQIMKVKLPAFGHDVEKQRIAMLKGEINRLRAEILAALQKPMEETLESVLTDQQKKTPAVIETHTNSVRAWRKWNKIDWIDALTRYGITAIGACLLLGLSTRTACMAGALFLAMVYVAMPALPWLPESPRLEGHYLFVNKNIIEMLALLTLATTRSGRWAGIDGLLWALRPWRRREPVAKSTSASRSEPASTRGREPSTQSS